MKTGVIKSGWLKFAKLRMDAQYWVRVTAQLEQDGVAPETATDEQVKSAIAKVEVALTSAHAGAKTKRALAQKLEREARALEHAPKPTKVAEQAGAPAETSEHEES